MTVLAAILASAVAVVLAVGGLVYLMTSGAVVEVLCLELAAFAFGALTIALLWLAIRAAVSDRPVRR